MSKTRALTNTHTYMTYTWKPAKTKKEKAKTSPFELIRSFAVLLLLCKRTAAWHMANEWIRHQTSFGTGLIVRHTICGKCFKLIMFAIAAHCALCMSGVGCALIIACEMGLLWNPPGFLSCRNNAKRCQLLIINAWYVWCMMYVYSNDVRCACLFFPTFSLYPLLRRTNWFDPMHTVAQMHYVGVLAIVLISSSVKVILVLNNWNFVALLHICLCNLSFNFNLQIFLASLIRCFVLCY